MSATKPERINALLAIRDRLPGTESPPQRQRLLEAMQTLGHVTTYEASRYLDCYDPRARKMELVKAGYPVVMTWRTVPTESGVMHRVGVYSLARAVVAA
jgi:Helix-turn-helix domain